MVAGAVEPGGRHLLPGHLRRLRPRQAGQLRDRSARGALVRVWAIGLALLLTACSTNESPEPAPAPPPSSSPQQQRWDPRDVDDLPPALDEVAPGLPDEVDPPDAAPSL